MLNGARRLRELLAQPGMLIGPGAHDVATAQVVEMLGFDVVYMGGMTIASASFGLPDIGLVGPMELLDQVERVIEAVNIPVFADLDDGGGNALRIRRLVNKAEHIGLAGFHIEDMEYANGKHFVDASGQMNFKRDRMRSKEQMADHIKAAVDARRNDDTVIVARTDAVAITSVEDAIDRAGAYGEAGADYVFCCHLKAEDIATVSAAVAVPLMHTRGLGPTLEQRAQMERDGLKFLVYPTLAPMASFQASWDVLAELKGTGGVSIKPGTGMAKYPEVSHAYEWTKHAEAYGMLG